MDGNEAAPQTGDNQNAEKSQRKTHEEDAPEDPPRQTLGLA